MTAPFKKLKKKLKRFRNKMCGLLKNKLRVKKCIKHKKKKSKPGPPRRTAPNTPPNNPAALPINNLEKNWDVVVYDGKA